MLSMSYPIFFIFTLPLSLHSRTTQHIVLFLTFKQSYWGANIPHKYYHHHAAKCVTCFNLSHLLFISFLLLKAQGSKPYRVACHKSRMRSGTPSHPRGSGNIFWSHLKSLSVPNQASPQLFRNRFLHLIPCPPICSWTTPTGVIGFDLQ